MTEGEFKAAAATLAGFPTIGLGGVWSIGSKKRRQFLIPGLDRFVWKSGKLVIVFDSDAYRREDLVGSLFNVAERGSVGRCAGLQG